MSFLVTNIQFKKENLIREFPSGVNKGELFDIFGGGGNKYTSLRYPIDLGSNLDKGHYVIFYINEQVKTRFKTSTTRDLPTIKRNRDRIRGEFTINDTTLESISEISSRIQNRLKGLSQNAALETLKGIDVTTEYKGNEVNAGIVIGALRQIINNSENGRPLEKIERYLKDLGEGSGIRTIRRTNRAIALYMPDTLAFSQRQSYSSLQLGGGGLAGAGAIFGVGQSIAQDYKDDKSFMKILTNALSNLSPFVAAKVAQEFGGSGLAVFATATGKVINPQLELLYSSPELRTFRFEFMFYPRSKKEAEEVIRMIELLRFHQAPEIGFGSDNPGSFLLTPPSEFDIKFYYNGQENTNIQKISTCVLSSLDVDYAPNGFSAYEVLGNAGGVADVAKGGTGMPTSIRMALEFIETEMLTKESISFTDHNFVTSNLGVDNQINRPVSASRGPIPGRVPELNPNETRINPQNRTVGR